MSPRRRVGQGLSRLLPLAVAVAGTLAEAAAAAEPQGEVALLFSQGEHRIRASLRPRGPKPGQLVELRLDLARRRDVPDPTYGELVPLDGAVLSVAFSGPGQRVRYLARPLGDAGSYGVHWTPSAQGLWSVRLEPVAGAGVAAAGAEVAGAEGAGSGDAAAAGPALSFELGVGVPMPASALAAEVQATRAVVGRSRRRQDPLAPVMREVAQRWLRLEAAGPGEAEAEAAAIALLLASGQGRAPRALAAAAPEFDALVQESVASVERIGRLPPGERPAALRAEELSGCLRCHLKFRDGIVEDLSRWPEVTPWAR